ncbi:efflux RND transporter periplasmic adaptor subunit [Paenibacillus silvisoli]|uniref:efflux RND transporter periplasmic adaptor subunit n=1 Tax=Paenibacillus silvisoli TaxID=3110539 RepID=UPI002804DA2B|nr:efflux RND transporter periplasmic adaptor subunit [Paenibacillus silvisoli]
MERQETEQVNTGRKRKIRLLAALFACGLIVLTLFSNTLQTMNVTKVWTTAGRQGELVRSFAGNGILEPVLEASLSNTAGWTVKSVKVKAGDAVKKGQTLVVYESREADDRYLDAMEQLEQQRLTIQGLQERYVEAASSGDDARLRGADRDLKSARLTLEGQRRSIDRMEIDLVSNRELKAPFDGMIRQVNAVDGLITASAGPDVQIASSSQGYRMRLPVPADFSELLKIGQKLDVLAGQTENGRKLKGIVTGIENKDAQFTIVVSVKHESLHGGEQARVRLDFHSADTGGILIPKEAVHKEAGAAYVYVIEENKGPLGNTSHVRKVLIETGDSNEFETVVLQGVFPDSPIILESSDPVSDGERVRVMKKS